MLGGGGGGHTRLITAVNSVDGVKLGDKTRGEQKGLGRGGEGSEKA